MAPTPPIRAVATLALALALAVALAACTQAPAPAPAAAKTTVALPPPPAPAPAWQPVSMRTLADTPCKVLPAIAAPPAIGGDSKDPAYLALKRSGTAAIPCLVAAVGSVDPLDTPQPLPGGAGEIRVGDLAFFLLVDFGAVDFNQALPPEVRTAAQARGVFAYFDWIGGDGHRAELQQRVRAQVQARPSASAAVLRPAPPAG